MAQVVSVSFTVVLSFRYRVSVPVEVRKVRPDVIAKLSGPEEIKGLPVWVGNTRTTVGEVFELSFEGEFTSDPNLITVVFEGQSTARLRYVGYRMEAGKIVVKGDVGPLAGFRMRGGELVVHGNAGDYLGAKMRGGKIEVFGDVGSFVGGKLIGERYGSGMKAGTIIVHGSAGAYIGHGMKKGDIVVEGSAGNYAGYGMEGVNIVILGDAGLYPGARMCGGRIVVKGRVEDVLCSFYIDDIVKSVKVKNIVINEPFVLFIGDVVRDGRGRLYVSYAKNRHIVEELEPLIRYEISDPFE